MKKYFLFFTFFSFVFELHAQWPTAVDTALFVDFGGYPYLVVDEGDQSLTVAYLRDNGIWAKKYDKFGYPLWGGNHVVLTDTAYGWLINELAYPSGQWGAVISDGEGGIIVAWEDYRHATFDWEGFPEGSEVYLQRVDKDGNILYGTHGMQISGPASIGWHSIGDMKTDYNGGFYIGFSRDSTNEQSVLKSYNKNGTLNWQYFFDKTYMDISATNTNGEVFIDIFGSRQKLDLSGAFLWQDSLIGSLNDSREYRHGGAFSDNNGGVIGVGGGGYLKIRRVDSTGQYAWDEVDLNEQQQGRIGYTPDNNGGIYVCWTEDSMRIQRIDRNGNIKFNPPLEVLGTATGTNIIHSKGGVIAIYGIAYDNISNLFAQKFDSNGVKLWPDSGIAFHITEEDFLFWPPVRMFSDQNEGALFLWNECCNGNRIYIKQISANGTLGEVITTIKDEKKTIPKNIVLFQNYPNPFNNSTTISLQIKTKDKVSLKIFNSLGKELKTLINKTLPAGFYSFAISMENSASGVYYLQLKTNNQTKTRKLLLIQ